MKNNVVPAGKTNRRIFFDCQRVFAKNFGCKYITLGDQLGFFPKHLTKLIGLHYGPRYDNMGSRSIWFGFCNAYTLGRQAQSETMTLIAVDSIFAVVYVKDVCLARVYSVRC